MRIVIDLQGAQSPANGAGDIGRRALALTEAMLRSSRDHEIVLALNSRYPDAIDQIKARLDGLAAPENFRVWQSAPPSSPCHARAQEKLYEAFLASLHPDVVLVTRLFESPGDPIVASIGSFAPLLTAVMLHDLDLSISPRQSFDDPMRGSRHLRKIADLRRANMWLATSDLSRREGVDHFGLDRERCFEVPMAIDEAEIFKWREAAQRVLDGLESLNETSKPSRPEVPGFHRLRPRLAYVTPLLRQGSDIASQCAALLPALSHYYDIELITDQQEMDAPLLATGFPVRTFDGFRNNEPDFDRVLYHFGNTELHEPMFDLLAENPGVVVLHDFYLGNAQACRESRADGTHAWTEALYASHGYPAVAERYRARDVAEIAVKFPCNFEVIAHAQGVLVHSQDAIELARQWFDRSVSEEWALIPAPRASDDEQAKDACARDHAAAIESFAAEAAHGRDGLIEAIRASDGPLADWEAAELATAIALSLPPPAPRRQLFIDVSELVQRDAKSGIQRVVKALLRALVDAPPVGYRIEPVYAEFGRQGYRYARKFMLDFLGCPVDALEDAPLDFRRGDVFAGLDLQPHLVPAQRAYYRRLRHAGVRVEFVVYDLLPILLAKRFAAGAAEIHAKWLEVVAENDGALCISQAVANELSSWVQDNVPEQRRKGLSIRAFKLGADLDASSPGAALPTDATGVLAAISALPSFLMVGTVEPRKGQLTALDAFEQLWAKGVQASLVIAGKQGWMVDDLAARLRRHRERGKRLFWIENASDAYLEKLYASSTCLLAASEGEGFGLPLIEAAKHGLAILASDLPVFREVAGTHAYYFDGNAPALAAAVIDWLALFGRDAHPRSEKMPFLTWQQSAEAFKAALFGIPGQSAGH